MGYILSAAGMVQPMVFQGHHLPFILQKMLSRRVNCRLMYGFSVQLKHASWDNEQDVEGQ